MHNQKRTDAESSIAQEKGKMRASVEHEHQIKSVDLFVDYTQRETDINIVSRKDGAFSDYLRDMLTPMTCPVCHSSHVKRSYRWSLKEWLLRFTGRKVFYCTDCRWSQVVKVYRWEWEVFATAFATLVIILIASVHWIKR
jgi:hypothetical protein